MESKIKSAPALKPPRKPSYWKENQDKILLGLAGVASLVVIYFMFIWDDSAAIRDQPVVASMTTTEKVRRRHSHNLTWGNVKGENPIFLRDIIYVPKGVKATITLSSKKVVQIPQNTMIQFDETTLENMEVLLENFRLMPLKRPTSKINPLLEDIRPYEMLFSELTARMYDLILRPLKLGRIEKAAKPEGPMQCGDYELHLVSPVYDRYNLAANRWMKMSWTPIPVKGTKFKLEMSRAKTFRRGLPYRTDKNILYTQFDDLGDFFWKVRATCKDEELNSEVWNFSMLLRGGKTPRRVALRRPSNGPEGIRLEIASDDKFANLVRSTVGLQNKCSLEGLPSGTYYCRVLKNASNKVVTSYQFEVP